MGRARSACRWVGSLVFGRGDRKGSGVAPTEAAPGLPGSRACGPDAFGSRRVVPGMLGPGPEVAGLDRGGGLCGDQAQLARIQIGPTAAVHPPAVDVGWATGVGLSVCRNAGLPGRPVCKPACLVTPAVAAQGAAGAGSKRTQEAPAGTAGVTPGSTSIGPPAAIESTKDRPMAG